MENTRKQRKPTTALEVLAAQWALADLTILIADLLSDRKLGSSDRLFSDRTSQQVIPKTASSVIRSMEKFKETGEEDFSSAMPHLRASFDIVISGRFERGSCRKRLSHYVGRFCANWLSGWAMGVYWPHGSLERNYKVSTQLREIGDIVGRPGFNGIIWRRRRPDPEGGIDPYLEPIIEKIEMMVATRFFQE